MTLPACGPVAQAIGYALNHWDGLARLLDDGRAELDINTAERAMRPAALSARDAPSAAASPDRQHARDQGLGAPVTLRPPRPYLRPCAIHQTKTDWRSVKKLFSTETINVQDRFRVWTEATHERFLPIERKRLDDSVFDAELEGTNLGGLLVTRARYAAHLVEATPTTIRHHDKRDFIALTIGLAGTAQCSQHGRTTVQKAGDVVLFDNNNPFTLGFPDVGRSLVIEMPREKMERMLGPVQLYAALGISGDLPGISLMRTFLDNLVRVHHTLSPDGAERMMSVGIDLMVAGIAERMARDTPKPLRDTVTVQRAKAYIVAHLHDTTLDPPLVAAAVGVSLRRLQQLFHDHGHHISDWTWQKRLEVSAQRLADPGFQHLSIDAVSYGCGFVNQAHFSRRFKDRYGMSPREYRKSSITNRADDI